MALSFYMLIMQTRSFLCLSKTRTCRAMASEAQQRNIVGGRERWATWTTGVPDVPSTWKSSLLWNLC